MTQTKKIPTKPKKKAKNKGGKKPNRTKAQIGMDKTKALEYRLMGLSYKDIAAKLNCCPAMAYNYVSACLKDQQREPAKEIINMEVGRLDEMLFALWGKVLKGDTKAIDTALRLMERRAKFLGLDAPKKLDVGGTDNDGKWRNDIAPLLSSKESRDMIVNLTIQAAKLADGDGEVKPDGNGNGNGNGNGD